MDLNFFEPAADRLPKPLARNPDEGWRFGSPKDQWRPGEAKLVNGLNFQEFPEETRTALAD